MEALDLNATSFNDSDYFSDANKLPCSYDIPDTRTVFKTLPVVGYVLVAILCLFCLLTIAIYIEEIVFIIKAFQISMRKKKVIWILAFYPVFSFCGLLGVIMPRAGTLIDMVANVFFGTCLYNFGRLMVDYMGGEERMWKIIQDERRVQMNTFPVCCCCVCLPRPPFTKTVYFRITLLVLQVAIIRPLLMFLAAILWTNGSYHAGSMSLFNGFIYITSMNVISTLFAVYGLMLLRGAFRPELEVQFQITGKIASIQLTLIMSAIPNLVLAILVAVGTIQCSALFPSKARGEEIYHGLLVLIMLPFSLMGRKFFRQVQDGHQYATSSSMSGTGNEEQLTNGGERFLRNSVASDIEKGETKSAIA